MAGMAGKNIGPDRLSKFEEVTQTIIVKVSEALGDRKSFLVGDQLSIADFKAAAGFFDIILNEKNMCGTELCDKAKEMLKANPAVNEYVETMRGVLKNHLESRFPSPW